MKTTWLASIALLLTVNLTYSQTTSGPAVWTDAQIRQILAERIDVHQQNVGIAVGLIDAKGRRIIAHGASEATGGSPVGGDTVFEIGSITKVFTSLLLADAVRRGEMALTDPIAKYLPSDVKVPQRAGQQITLRELAMHHSALPRLPANLKPAVPLNPYADYSVAQLYEFLSGHELTRDIGSRYEYSNLGAGLLGHILARRAGMEYEALVKQRITGPLGMKSTAVTLDAALTKRLAQGHNAQRKAVPNWDLPTLAGAGALRSTVNDMLNFLSAQLGYTKSPLAAAMDATLAERRPTGGPRMDVALGWHIQTTPAGGEIVWHNGGTGGYRTYMGFDPKARVGVVVLSNMSTPAGVDDIGRHLLDPSLPLSKPTPARKSIALDPAVFDRYVGKYELKPGFVLTITREEGRFFLQATDQPRFEMFAESERVFFLKAPEAEVVFEVDAQGRASGLILHQGGGKFTGKRIE